MKSDTLPETIVDKASPFHEGEQQMQEWAGRREKAERYGQKAIRDYMPDQHRFFFEQLPFLIGACVDDDGWPWASVISGAVGFVKSPSSTSLTLDRSSLNKLQSRQDPVAIALSKVGVPLGLLGIDLTTRRRNRVNVTVTSTLETIELTVEQSFGNCPQYIQTREFEHAGLVSTQTNTDQVTILDQEAIALIHSSDTFFVASAYSESKKALSSKAVRSNAFGVDVSHRGGLPGFVKVNENELIIPDFSGNNFFNTLGNFVVNPRAGLVFIDFESGELLLLSGTVKLLAANHPEIAKFEKANCGWCFSLVKGLKIKNGFPFSSTFKAYSPKSINAGIWPSTKT